MKEGESVTDKNKDNHQSHRKHFYDVSFDGPLDENNHYRRQKNHQHNPNSADLSSDSKREDFYHRFKEREKEQYSEIDEEILNTHQPLNQKADNSNVMLDRSIRRVQKLFTDLREDNNDYSEIKAAKTRNLKEREQQRSLYTNRSNNKRTPSPSNKEDGIERNEFVRKKDKPRNQLNYRSEKHPSNDNSNINQPISVNHDSNRRNHNEYNSSNGNSQAKSTRDYPSDIPSPEDIRSIRERRRKMRIEELEQMTTEEDIVRTYQSSLNRQQPEIVYSPDKAVKRVDRKQSEPNQYEFKPNLAEQLAIDTKPLNLPTEVLAFNKKDKTKLKKETSLAVINEVPLAVSNKQPNSNIDNLSQPVLPREVVSADDNEFWESSLHYANETVENTNIENNEDSLQDNRKKRKIKKSEAYSLKGLTIKDKAFFGFNVTFNVVKKLIIYAVLIIVLIGVLVGGAGVGYFANLVGQTEPPTEQEMAEQINRFEQQSTLYYSDGEPIADIRTDVVRSYATLDEISDYITDGFIATEDEYFTEHPGIVPKAIFRAVLETFLTGSGTGGSTLTQQLVKQQMLSNDVTFFRKANEILLALRLENYFSKDEILTAYLNVSPFGRNNNGDNVAGIAKASEGIFGVSPADVSLNQAAFLVGLPQDPYVYTPYAQTGEYRPLESIQPGIDRMREVLFRMYREQKITKEEYETALEYDITQDFITPEPREEERQSYLYQAMMHGAIEKLMLLNIQDDGYSWQQVYSDAEWYNDYYFAAENQLRTGGYKVYTTIEKDIYDLLQNSARAYEDELGVMYDGVYTNPETGHETYYVEKIQTGLVVIDNTTGRVLGFVAGTDFDNNQIDHAFQMRRSPGSTIKPLAVYGPAVEENLINPSTVIPDTRFVEEYSDGSTWEPTNYGNAVSDTLLTARTALLRSDNLPAVRIYEELINRGVPIIDYLEAMGFNTVDSYTEEDTHNLAFSLGGVTTGPTVFEETRAFTTFANNGNYVDGYYIDRIEDSFGNVVFQQNSQPRRVFSEDTNYLMVDMLRDTMTEGTGRTARDNMIMSGDWIAKTGISENSKDIWVLGSTPAITIGSWIGYDSRFADYTIDVNDGYGLESVRSQIYWANIVNDLYEAHPDIFGTELTFEQPNSVQEQTVLEQTGTLPGSISYNGSTFQLTGPTKTELFKTSAPAPPLTADFIFAGTEDDIARFWSGVVSQEAQRRRQQQQQQQQNVEDDDEDDDDESDENGEEGDDESPDNGEDGNNELPPDSVEGENPETAPPGP